MTYAKSLNSRVYIAVALASLISACETTPEPSDGGRADSGPRLDGGPVIAPMCDDVTRERPPRACVPLETDYAAPRTGGDAHWPACVSDGGEYVQIEPVISTIARVRAFEELRDLLFDPSRDPSSDDFLAGRLLYQEEQGLDSRVVRRYDPHFEVPASVDCTLDGVPEMFPDYCVGPARLQPVILAAFDAGIRGTGAEAPRVHAARIEAALMWFLYASVYKEAVTCARQARDCDSTYAYYAGGEPARDGVGLAADVARTDPEAHDRAWDGLLALRCWRDLDDAEIATDEALHLRARTQLDRAVLVGVASIVRERVLMVCDAEGAELAYHFAYLKTLAPVLDRAMRLEDAARADAFAAAIDVTTPDEVDAATAIDAIDATFDCP